MSAIFLTLQLSIIIWGSRREIIKQLLVLSYAFGILGRVLHRLEFRDGRLLLDGRFNFLGGFLRHNVFVIGLILSKLSILPYSLN